MEKDTTEFYGEWMDDFFGLKPHRWENNDSFNNIVFTGELVVSKLCLGTLTDGDVYRAKQHLLLTDTPEGLYAPKSSHDNLTMKMVTAQAIGATSFIDNMDIDAANKGKHPRDRIFWRYVTSSGIKRVLWGLLMWFPALDMVRAILDSGKVRPEPWESWVKFKVRVKALFCKPKREAVIMGGRAEWYEVGGKEERIIYVQNDGKILTMYRLWLLKERCGRLWHPFIRLCHKMYVKKMGPRFQSVMFANYFKESDHPVRWAADLMDDLGITPMDLP